MATSNQAVGSGPAILQAASFTLELGTAATGITVPLQDGGEEHKQEEGRKESSYRQRGKNSCRERMEQRERREKEKE